jgi:hypothetical protein
MKLTLNPFENIGNGLKEMRKNKFVMNTLKANYQLKKMPSKCTNQNGRIVCGALHAGGKVPAKGGVFRLAKGEKVYKDMAHLKKAGGVSKAPHKKCSCKKH